MRKVFFIIFCIMICACSNQKHIMTYRYVLSLTGCFEDTVNYYSIYLQMEKKRNTFIADSISPSISFLPVFSHQTDIKDSSIFINNKNGTFKIFSSEDYRKEIEYKFHSEDSSTWFVLRPYHHGIEKPNEYYYSLYEDTVQEIEYGVVKFNPNFGIQRIYSIRYVIDLMEVKNGRKKVLFKDYFRNKYCGK